MTERSKADQLIADLVEWAANTGGWEAPVWDRARAYMEKVRDREHAEIDSRGAE